MKTMVEQVVDVLDNTDLNENALGKSLSQMGYGKTRYDKKSKMVYRPADPTFFRHDKHWMKNKRNVKFLRKTLIDQEKERRRKIIKKSHPNKPLEWTGSRWVVKEELHCILFVCSGVFEVFRDVLSDLSFDIPDSTFLLQPFSFSTEPPIPTVRRLISFSS